MSIRTHVCACVTIAAMSLAVGGCHANANATASASAAASDAKTMQTSVERGKYLVTIVGCNDCHTPKKMGPNGPELDTARLLSGHPEQAKMPAPPAASQAWPIAVAPDLTAWSGPWGRSFAANLTPDQNTGLGIWTEDMFIQAIRTGKHMGKSRPILPPMPWQEFSQMSDVDLKAIYAYLRTIPAVVNHVPEPEPPAGASH